MRMKGKFSGSVIWLLVCIMCFSSVAFGCTTETPEAQQRITVTLSVEGNGQAFTDKPKYNKGDDVTVTMQADSGNKLSSVTVNGENAASQVSGETLVIPSVRVDLAITVTFEKIGAAHKHTYADAWSYNRKYHWKDSTCEHKLKGYKAEHTLDANKRCTTCGYTDTSALKDPLHSPSTPRPIDNSFTVGDVRVQILSESLFRAEDKGGSGFEDRASFTVSNREDWSDVSAVKSTGAGETLITTSRYVVHIPDGGSADDVYATDRSDNELYRYKGNTGTSVYIPSPSDELKSWYFTDSPRVIPSYYGYSVDYADDPLQGWDFSGKNVTDIFVFLPNGDYSDFCQNYTDLTGKSELVKLSTLGFWDSRWYAYTEQTALQQIRDYRDRGYSIDVLVIDTDWRKKDGTAGTGYEINDRLFPDMARFIESCEDMGVDIMFNDHPEPVNGTSNGLDKNEVDYRNRNLTLILSLGLDYWWYDRNWSVALNSCDSDISVYTFGMYAYQWVTQDYLYGITNLDEYAERALIMGNIDGCEHGVWKYASEIAAHRYSFQWTGDIMSDSAALKQEIYATLFGGAEVGLPYLSSDLGGHVGSVSNEQYIRWLQYGLLSPISRVHCTSGLTRMPWMFGTRAESVVHTYMDMRYRLMPLFYSLAYRNYTTGLPLVARTDINYPEYAEASANDQYLLGDYILIAPIENSTGNDAREVFIPDGTWIDVWSGEKFVGPRTVTVTHDLDTSPVFVREGALVPLARNAESTSATDWRELSLDVYPSKNFEASSTLYEDDTKTVAYKDGKSRTTDISMSFDGAKNAVKVNIGAAQGSFDGQLAFNERKWNIRVHKNADWGEVTKVVIGGRQLGANEVKRIAKSANGKPFAFDGAALDGDVYTFSFSGSVSTATEIEIYFSSYTDSAVNTEYNRTATPFDMTVDIASSCDLTRLGTADWFSYDGRQATVKKNGAGLMTGFCAECESISVKNGNVSRSYTDGNGENAGGGSSLALTSMRHLSGKIKVKSGVDKYVIVVGGEKCLAKITVRDRAGNVRTEYFGSMTASFDKAITIETDGATDGELYVDYAVYASKQQLGADRTQLGAGVNSESLIRVYCGYAVNAAAAKQNASALDALKPVFCGI